MAYNFLPYDQDQLFLLPLSIREWVSEGSLAHFVSGAALIDRLLHHCHVVSIRGNSYRMRHHTELYAALTPTAERDESQPRRRRDRREAMTP